MNVQTPAEKKIVAPERRETLCVTPHNHLAFLREYVLSRIDVYARQTQDGRYQKVGKPLSMEAIDRHLDHKITVGTYNTSLEGTCKFLLFDLDNHEGADITPGIIVREKVRRLTSTLRHLEIPYTLSESSPGSYHIYVFLHDATTADAYDYGRWIGEQSGIEDIEVFPKQREVPDGEYGNLIRLPFSKHQRKGTSYQFIDDSFNPVTEFTVTKVVAPSAAPALVPVRVEPVTEPMAPTVVANNATTGGIPPCLTTLLQSGAQLTGGGGHYTRIAIVCAFRDAGLNHAQLCKLFMNQEDYDLTETSKQVKSILKKSGGYSYTCRSLKAKCGKFVLGMCDKCGRDKVYKRLEQRG